MPATTTRAWLLATLDEAGQRLNTVTGAGATDPQVCWTDADGNTITVKLHGEGITLEAKGPDGQQRIAPTKMPFGWTQEA